MEAFSQLFPEFKPRSQELELMANRVAFQVQAIIPSESGCF
jgi:hypothetical protein